MEMKRTVGKGVWRESELRLGQAESVPLSLSLLSVNCAV